MLKSRSLKVIAAFLLNACLTLSLYAKTTVLIDDDDWPPFFMPKNSEMKGIGKELLNLCINQQEYILNFKVIPIKRTHKYMEVGIIDVNVLSFKEARTKFVIYGKEPLFSTEYGFAVKADSHIDIHSLDDLTPYILGDLSGLSYTLEYNDILAKKRSNKQVSTGYSLDSMFDQMLASTPRFDIMANAKSTISWRAKSLGVSDKVKILDFNLSSKKYFVTVSKKSQNIKNAQVFLSNIDSCLRELKKNGLYQEIMLRYGLDFHLTNS